MVAITPHPDSEHTKDVHAPHNENRHLIELLEERDTSLKQAVTENKSLKARVGALEREVDSLKEIIQV